MSLKYLLLGACIILGSLRKGRKATIFAIITVAGALAVSYILDLK